MAVNRSKESLKNTAGQVEVSHLISRGELHRDLNRLGSTHAHDWLLPYLLTIEHLEVEEVEPHWESRA